MTPDTDSGRQGPSESTNRDEGREYVACNLCGADDTVVVFVGRDVRRGVPGEFPVVRCRRCALVYLNPRPDRTGIGRYYPEDYALHGLEDLPAEQHYYWLFRRPTVPRGSRVLDVGAGGGRYLRFLAACGYEVAGLEISEKVADAVRRDLGFEMYAGTLDEAAIPAESYDLVTMWWSLEHMHDPLGALRAAHRVLVPGGKIIVSVPNFASLARRLFGQHWHHADTPGHLYLFEPGTLTRALEETGFRVDRVRQDLLAKEFAPSLGASLGARP